MPFTNDTSLRSRCLSPGNGGRNGYIPQDPWSALSIGPSAGQAVPIWGWHCDPRNSNVTNSLIRNGPHSVHICPGSVDGPAAPDPPAIDVKFLGLVHMVHLKMVYGQRIWVGQKRLFSGTTTDLSRAPWTRAAGRSWWPCSIKPSSARKRPSGTPNRDSTACSEFFRRRKTDPRGTSFPIFRIGMNMFAWQPRRKSWDFSSLAIRWRSTKETGRPPRAQHRGNRCH